MIISKNWLKELLGKEAHLLEDSQKLADSLVQLGVEVEGFEDLAQKCSGVVVGKLIRVDKHPQADRLTLCEVSDGKESFPVVCGAKNHKAGDLVAFAKVGAELPGDFKIKKAKLRGIESFGMLCSSKELGLDEDAEGILILDQDSKVGEDIGKVLDFEDVLFDVSLTANRGDCLSHLGIARECALIEKKKIKSKVPPLAEDPSLLISNLIQVESETEACWDYRGRVIEDINVGPSPQWLKNRLRKMGLRPINNVVDITNYVLFELGQPLHAFDYEKLSLQGGLGHRKILVRQAMKNEKLQTLDGEDRELSAEDMVITDGARPVALAGVMGGLESSVVEGQTKRILVESARFDPVSVRRSSKRHGITSDSSYRFERGVDPDGVQRALDRACYLIRKVAGGRLAKGSAKLAGKFEDKPMKTILFHQDLCEKRLAYRLASEQIVQDFRALGADVAPVSGNEKVVQVTPPSWRLDLEREVDLIEEIARVEGYEKIPELLPPINPSDPNPILMRSREEFKFREKIRETLSSLGYRECIHFSFCGEKDFEDFYLDASRAPKIENALSSEHELLKSSLVPGLIQSLQYNEQHHGDPQMAFFEIRKTFDKNLDSETGVTEHYRLAMVKSGSRFSQHPTTPQVDTDVFDLKGDFEILLRRLGYDAPRMDKLSFKNEVSEKEQGIKRPPYLHPGVSASICIEESSFNLGHLGGLHPGIIDALDLPESVYLLECDLDGLFQNIPLRRYQAVSKFPPSRRDLAFLVPNDVTMAELVHQVRKYGGEHLKEVKPFDLYQGNGVPEGQKSIALSLSFQALQKTLKDKEIQHSVDEIVKGVGSDLGAKQRE
jgi:phenylalanyl-tRNA synthetase beta chain